MYVYILTNDKQQRARSRLQPNRPANRCRCLLVSAKGETGWRCCQKHTGIVQSSLRSSSATSCSMPKVSSKETASSKISYLWYRVSSVSVLSYICGAFSECPDCRGPTPWQPSLKILSVFATEGFAVSLVVRSHRQKLDRMAPVLAFDPRVGRTVVQHLGLHSGRRDVRFP